MAVTTYAFLIAQSFIEGLSKGDADVLHGVMRIDLKITLRMNPDVHHAVTCYLIQHMVKKRQSGLKFRITLTVQINLDPNRGFFRLATNLGRARAHTSLQQPHL